ncbi:MAG: AraC family transcriptional regulator, partial [Algicola sp.]|nr:AraC family transcriptional regulator [Algicola sp.]
TEYGVNFSRYIRERRVDAAKVLLLGEPDSSVLAISLETGFKSQSNFYAAFKEITNQSPGQFRKANNC